MVSNQAMANPIIRDSYVWHPWNLPRRKNGQRRFHIGISNFEVLALKLDMAHPVRRIFISGKILHAPDTQVNHLADVVRVPAPLRKHQHLDEPSPLEHCKFDHELLLFLVRLGVAPYTVYGWVITRAIGKRRACRHF
jgi:hypothetical protein